MNLVEATLTRAERRLGRGVRRLPPARARRGARGAARRSRGYEGRKVVLGIRPEDMEDASLVSDAPAERRITSTVELREALGSDVVVHFTIDAPPATDRRRQGARRRRRPGGARTRREAGARAAVDVAGAAEPAHARFARASGSSSWSTRNACISSTPTTGRASTQRRAPADASEQAREADTEAQHKEKDMRLRTMMIPLVARRAASRRRAAATDRHRRRAAARARSAVGSEPNTGKVNLLSAGEPEEVAGVPGDLRRPHQLEDRLQGRGRVGRRLRGAVPDPRRGRHARRRRRAAAGRDPEARRQGLDRVARGPRASTSTS